MIAGTETTATALSGLTYLLLKHPDKLERLVDEIRSVHNAKSLTGDDLKQMKYLQACLEECLRSIRPHRGTLAVSTAISLCTGL